MPLVRSAGGGGGGISAPAAVAPGPAVPRAALPIRLDAHGLPIGGGARGQLRRAQQAAAHTGGILDPLSAPANRLIAALSQPAFAVGSLLSGHPLESLRHLGSIPAGVAGIAAPQITELYNRIPGLAAHENVLPSQSALLAPLVNALPGGVKQAVGFTSDVALDPLSYLTFGAAGAARGAAGLGVRAAQAERTAADEIIRNIARAPAGTHNQADIARAIIRSDEAKVAERAARGRGAHVGVNLPWRPGAGTEIGTIPGSRQISRGASYLAGKVPAGAKGEFADVSKYFRTGGMVGSVPEYQAATVLQRVASLEKQIGRREINREVGAPLQKALSGLNKAGSRTPEGTKWNFSNAGRQIIDNIEQGAERFPIPKELEPVRDWVAQHPDRLIGVEQGAGIPVREATGVLGYVPRRLKNARDLARFETWKKTHGIQTHTTPDPFFIHQRHFDTHEAMRKHPATEEDVAAGIAKKVGDPLFDPETNLVKLLHARNDAHVDVMRQNAVRRVMTERHGLRRPMPADVPVEAARAQARAAAGELQRLTRPTDVSPLRAEVASAAGRVRGAQRGVAVAERPPRPPRRGAAPYEPVPGMRLTRPGGRLITREPREGGPVHEALVSRRGRLLRSAQAGQGEARVALRTARGAKEAPEVVAAHQATLKDARRNVETARKAVLRAERTNDPIAIRRAHQSLRAAQRDHINSRLALARVRGTYAGTAAQIRTATRRAVESRRKLLTLEVKNERAQEIRARLVRQPGHEATPQEWGDAMKGWDTAGIVGMEDVRLPPEMTKVLEQMQHEITRSFRKEEGANPILKYLRRITSHWKALALISPGYHLRNAYGDSIGSWWAGARNPISFIQAGRILKAADNPEKLAGMTIRIGGEEMSGEEFLREARAMGIWGQGGSAVEPGFSLARDSKYTDEQGALRKQLGFLRNVRAPGRGGLARRSQAIGQMREDATRLGTYLDLRKQGRGIIDSAEQTHKYLFDYGHVSDFVDEARRFWAPFITYTSKAAPRTLKQAATRPGYFPHHLELATQLSDAAGVEPGGPTNLPIGQRSSFGLPDPGGLLHRILGMPADQPILWNPERVGPWGTLNTLDPTNWQQTIASNFPNPLIKTPVEVATGHRFYYAGNAPRRAVAPALIQALHRAGIPIPDYGTKTVAALGRDVPGYSAALDAYLQMLPVYGQAGRIGNVDDPQRMRASIASFLAGLPVTAYNRAQLAAQAQKYGG